MCVGNYGPTLSDKCCMCALVCVRVCVRWSLRYRSREQSRESERLRVRLHLQRQNWTQFTGSVAFGAFRVFCSRWSKLAEWLWQTHSVRRRCRCKVNNNIKPSRRDFRFFFLSLSFFFFLAIICCLSWLEACHLEQNQKSDSQSGGAVISQRKKKTKTCVCLHEACANVHLL